MGRDPRFLPKIGLPWRVAATICHSLVDAKITPHESARVRKMHFLPTADFSIKTSRNRQDVIRLLSDEIAPKKRPKPVSFVGRVRGDGFEIQQTPSPFELTVLVQGRIFRDEHGTLIKASTSLNVGGLLFFPLMAFMICTWAESHFWLAIAGAAFLVVGYLSTVSDFHRKSTAAEAFRNKLLCDTQD